MARPIRNTPILTGKDATLFIKEASQTPSVQSRQAERVRIEASVKRLEAMLAALPL